MSLQSHKKGPLEGEQLEFPAVLDACCGPRLMWFEIVGQDMRYWTQVTKFDPRAARLADGHYSRRTVGSPQFMPPGETIVLLAMRSRAVWGWWRPAPSERPEVNERTRRMDMHDIQKHQPSGALVGAGVRRGASARGTHDRSGRNADLRVGLARAIQQPRVLF